MAIASTSLGPPCDVVIVGAGPVGMLLAIKLKLQNVDVRVVERQAALYPLPRAIALDHESQRNLYSAGIADELDEILEDVRLWSEGGHGPSMKSVAAWRDRDLKVIVDLDWSATARSGFASASGFSQPQLEQILERRLLSLGVPLIRGMALKDLLQEEGQVCANFEPFSLDAQEKDKRIIAEGARHTVRCSYLVGCDGANSTTRGLSGIKQTDLNFANDWLIADILLQDGYVPPKVADIRCAQICDPERPTTVAFSGHGRKRLEFMRLPGESQAEMMKEENLWKFLKPWGFAPGNCQLERKVMYTFRARWAEQFFHNRIILAGDSAHLMPPFIGQGLNSGLRDAAALAWRLPMMINGLGEPQCLLQSYQSERLDHVVKLTRHCTLLGEVVCETRSEKAQVIHSQLRANPPKNGYDPPLGKSCLLSGQEASGKLSYHRKLRSNKQQEAVYFDSRYGYGWRLIHIGDEDIRDNMDAESHDFFCSQLQGKIVEISREEDYEKEYRAWFRSEMHEDDVVLVRPDFYVFGHAPARKASELVKLLKEALRPRRD